MTAVLQAPRAVPGSPRRARPYALAVLALFAAVFAVVAHQLLFDQGSPNNDDVAYLLQAQAIARGELFLDAPPPAEAYQPWFFVERDVGFVSKYLPLVSALLAVGLATTGSVAPVLAVLAALVPLLTAALAREVGLDRRTGVQAAALVSLSPLMLMHTALPLSYVPFVVLVCTSWLLQLRLGLGRAGPVTAALLGLAGVAAACARPLDAVLLLAPGLVWIARKRRDDLVPVAGGLVLGALPLLVAIGAYNTVVSGAPWVLPFSLLEPDDALGYGVRRLLPEDVGTSFYPPQGVQALVVHFGVGSLSWYALGALLVPAAVVAWRRPGTSEATRVLLVGVLVLLVAYTAFWGPYNYTFLWKQGARVMGPVYGVALLVPVVLAGLPVLKEWLAARRLVRGLAGLAVLVALTQLVAAVVYATVDARRTDILLRATAGPRAAGSLLINVDPPYLGHPVTGLVAGAALSAYAPVPAAGEPLPTMLQLPRSVYGLRDFVYAVQETVRLEGPEVPVRVSLAGRRSDVLVVERDGRATACDLFRGVDIAVTPTGSTGCTGVPVPAKWTDNPFRHCPDTSCVALAVFREDGSGLLRRQAWRQLPVANGPGTVALLADGRQLEGVGSGWVSVTPR